MKKIAIGLATASLIIGGSAFAAPGDARRDNDRVVTRSEIQTKAAERFARLDTNKDGKLDQTDRQARREERRTQMFARLDANNDGQISKAEFTADKAGARGPRMAAGEGRKDGIGKRGGHGGHHGRGGGMMMGRMADANGDRTITQAEFTAAALKRFDTMDANKDGQVTPAERQTAREQMKAKWQQMRATKAQG